MDILGDTAWTVAINTTTNATATNATFYIIPTSASFEPVGFVTANQTAPTGAVTTSFELYGSQVVYIADDSFEAQFWAKTTNASDVWEIRWNADGVAEDDSVPVTLKVIPSTTWVGSKGFKLDTWVRKWSDWNCEWMCVLSSDAIQVTPFE